MKKDDIINLAKTAEQINAQPVIVVMKGRPKIPLIAHAIKKHVIIMSGEAIKLLAKKINYPHW
ncbi:MAG: hypothetical protein ACP6IP_04765 [Candidatus Njordarchaeia archaeon]